MHSGPTRRGLALVAAMSLLAACADRGPTAAPSNGRATPGPTATTLPAPTVLPSPTASVPASFPLAVVTGLTNHRSVIELDSLASLASDGKLVVPCGIAINQPALTTTASCIPANGIAAAILADQQLIALLPPGLVEPATKVLPIAGDGPYGLFGPDLFGDSQSRALPYPVVGAPTGEPALDPAWTAYDVSQVWTMTAVGSLCADRGGARQAVTLGKGWDYIFDGGTAKYKGPPIPNPNPPPGIDLHPIVRPVETGNDGLTSSLSKRADVALAAHKCPIQTDDAWIPPPGRAGNFAVPEAVLSRWQDFLGIDAVYLPADHQSDRGVAGIRSTLRLLDKYGIAHTGLGLTLDQALEPAIVTVGGRKVAFVAWDEVPGPVHAGATTAGVAWLNRANIRAATDRARAAGADVIVCDPIWWNGTEYALAIWPRMLRQVGWFDTYGCDQVIGAGLHLAGPVLLGKLSTGGSRFVLSTSGNYLFGQDFWQLTQEGVILEEKFVGTRLVNVRLHPYVMINAARPALLDPEGDGHYVLDRIWKISDLDYQP